ncbi:MAG TPA: hypothetical protein VE082_00435 [Desulfobaccales bacterium]|nr:hypothetical protein [Desulfobaccales bacterium]
MATKLRISNPDLRRLEACGDLEGVKDLSVPEQEAVRLLSRLVEITKQPDFFLQMWPLLSDVKDFLEKRHD